MRFGVLFPTQNARYFIIKFYIVRYPVLLISAVLFALIDWLLPMFRELDFRAPFLGKLISYGFVLAYLTFIKNDYYISWDFRAGESGLRAHFPLFSVPYQ